MINTSQPSDRGCVLVTGASSGIGKATAKRLAVAGYHVFAAARRLEKMTDLQSDRITVLPLDITKEESVRSLVETISTQTERLDVLINNAGYGSHGALEAVSLEEARYQFEVNVFGLMHLTQLILPIMRQQRGGKIINVSSMIGKVSVPMSGWYSASKHVLEALSDALRLEVQQFGIKVVVIEPGAIKTEFNDIAAERVNKASSIDAYQSWTEAWIKVLNSSNQTGAEPEVIAEAITKAVKTKNPRSRYAAPFESKFFLFLKWLLSDRLFDRVVLSEIKKRQKLVSPSISPIAE
ncbi:oxidoreductase [Pleurocapsa sp. PCC 7319]|uniref:oxidoreductase n=1 Tax=Pleurocapsa sp. PCC 7319 TaxID=118161 RepID=UPI00034DA1FF|nr:oxidoreductase [Pleurocapsa sp. PCC 7319]